MAKMYLNFKFQIKFKSLNNEKIQKNYLLKREINVVNQFENAI